MKKKSLYEPKHLKKLSIMIEKKIRKERSREKGLLGKLNRKIFFH